MNRLIKSLVYVGVSAVLFLSLNGCATVDFREVCQSDGSVSGSTIVGFSPYQTVEEVKATVLKMGYESTPRRGAETLLEDLLDESRRDKHVGRTVTFERSDRTTRTIYRVDLKFNEYFTLENIIVTHRQVSEEESQIIQSYLAKYPMLVFQSSEDGENYNHKTKEKEKITNTNYHFEDGRYAFFHLNHFRTHKDDGQFSDVITFNAHDSAFVVTEAYKKNYRIPKLSEQNIDDEYDDH